MPELPEVETIKRHLQPNIIGKIISDIKILSPKNFIGEKKQIIGRKITDVKRHGKVLVFKLYKLYKPYNFMNFHLKLTGQMLYTKNIKHAVFQNTIPFTKGKIMPANTTRVIIEFKDGSGLFFNDLRKFGWIKISDKPLIPKGIDILSKEFTINKLIQLVLTSSQPIKLFLMDQDKITGIGNIYANDALFLAKIHPLRKSKTLTEEQIKKLYLAIKKVICEGLEHGGSSAADEAFINPSGEKGCHQQFFLVYQRESQPCRDCKTPIKRIKHSGRSSFFCPNCQET